MANINPDTPIPPFEVAATSGRSVRSADLAGHPYVLYFYPKDSTPGCTTEGKDFRDHHDRFVQQGIAVFGVSRDKLTSHEKFKAKHDFPFELIADTDEKLCQLFGVIKDKNLFGKKVKGIERSTFLIDADGVLRQEWRKVKVAGHVQNVLDAAMSL